MLLVADSSPSVGSVSVPADVVAPRRRPVKLTRPKPPTRTASVDIVHLSFEGPDRYASAGGLGVRVTNLAEALAATGLTPNLYFIGDPDLPAIERRNGVVLHRWCQSISARARRGVYDAEEDKVADLCTSWPRHITARVARNATAGRHTVVLAEDWHTVWPLIGLHDELRRHGLRHAATLAWTANNRFGFDRIDFSRLDDAATILTISRAMKHLMWGHGVNPLVVPNGIPDATLEPVDPITSRVWAEALAGITTLAKVGRWDPDKRWHMAIDAVAALRTRGERAVLLARGWNGDPAATAHHDELRRHAAQLGLEWVRCDDGGDSGVSLARALGAAVPRCGGVVELTFPIAGPTLQSFYAGSTLTLANSGFEPFGLVGLEAMAAGSIVVTGSTGEDYVRPFESGFALDTDDPREIVRSLDWLRRKPNRVEAMRAAAVSTAERYRWASMIDRLWFALDR